MLKKRILVLMFLLLLLPLVGCFPPPTNQVPILTSDPIATATVGIEYVYDVNATDPDGDTLTYSLTVKPTGMTINSATGLIKWTPVTAQIGDNPVTVKVSDGALDVIQKFTIKVKAVNHAPTINSIPITTATVGITYVYDVNATDPDGDILTYSITAYQPGMTIGSASGLIMWTPTAKGNYAVVVKVSDGALSDTQGFTIEVGEIPPDNHAPTINSIPSLTATVGVAFTYDVNATDPDGDALAYYLITYPSNMTINSATGVISWIPTLAQVGSNPVIVKAFDGALSDTQSFMITVTMPVMVGTVTITGDVKYAETLTADIISGITYIPPTVLDVPTYQWKRDGGAISGATSNTYTLIVDDIGALITVTVTADGIHATGSVTSTATAAVVEAVIDIAAIPGVTAPATGAIPITEITETDQYTGTVTWSPAHDPFQGSIIYTATITLTPETGYTLTGVEADFFTVAGATATNPADSGVVSAVFPETEPADIVAAGVTGFVVVATGGIPIVVGDLEPEDATKYTVTGLTWAPPDSPYVGLNSPAPGDVPTVYTATVELTSETGYKFPVGGILVPTAAAGGGTVVSAGITSGGDVSGNTLTFEVEFPETI